MRRARRGCLAGVATAAVLCFLSAEAQARTITVDTLAGTAADDGACSLHEAITAANEDAREDGCRRGEDADTIVFDVPAPGSLIQVGSALPPITERVVLDGSSEPDPGSDRIVLDGDSAGGANGLTVEAGRTTIRGFVVIDFAFDGINIAANRTKVVDCRVGTSAIVSSDGNGNQGIDVAGNDNRIGGKTAASGNLVSGNTQEGVFVDGTGNAVRNNLVGTIANGGSGLGNGLDGIEIEGEANVVGPGNVVSSNETDGIDLDGSRHLVRGNIVGLTADGEFSVSNHANGVLVSASRSVIGGAEVADRNFISSNDLDGVRVDPQGGPAADRNRILGNFIGLEPGGDEQQGNGAAGITVDESSDNTIGGTTKGTGNRIVANGGDGVRVTAIDSLRNSILRNSIHSNAGLGIDLGDDGVTDNDIGMGGEGNDNDVGPNNLQNFPFFTDFGPASNRFEFALQTTADRRFRIELFASDEADPTDFGEGQRFAAAKVVRTNAAGIAQGAIVADPMPAGGFVSLTATRLGPDDDPLDTSELGQTSGIP